MSESNEFEIFRSEAGYVAVTNESRRKILGALAKKERDLTELVKITGKAKPTLSNLHMRELLAQKLIEELPHPTDQRKKIYRLIGQRIGASSVPIETLRGAVKQYVSASPLAHAMPLQQILDILIAGGPMSEDVLGRQAMKLGALSSHLFTAPDLREALPRVAGYWEREGISRTTQIDLEHLGLELEVAPRYCETRTALRLTATLLAGFLQGAFQEKLGDLHATGASVGTSRVRLRVVAKA